MTIFDTPALLDAFEEAQRYLAENPGDHYIVFICGSKSKDETLHPPQPSQLRAVPKFILLDAIPVPTATDPGA